LAAILRALRRPIEGGRSRLCPATAEFESDPVNGFDRGLAAGRRHLGADVADMAVDGAVGDMNIAGIGGIQDQLAREHEAGSRHQRTQDREFERGQRNRFVRKTGGSGICVDGEFTVFERFGFRRWRRDAGTAEDRIHPRDQFARAERFGYVVIAADLKAEDAVDLLVTRRQEQDRRLRGFF
jgi:hypothetical protein